jgi:hypothetical protein
MGLDIRLILIANWNKMKTAVCDQHMQVGVVAEQIAEGLDGDDRAGHRIAVP